MSQLVDTKISAVIITFNEERNIARCIKSILTVADEIVIVDSFSTDQTEKIASSFPKVVFFRSKWMGYSSSKNYANSLASHDWILSLDADEELSGPLIEAIQHWKKSAPPLPAGFNRLTNYCGKWIHHCGWYPDFKFRLFNRNVYSWQGEIHEQLFRHDAQPQSIQRLNGDCLHYSYYSEEEHWTQTLKFSRIWAEQAFQKKRKYSAFKRRFGPFIRFLRDYFLKMGFLDGWAGMKICWVSSRGIALRQTFLLEKIQSTKDADT